MAATSDTKPKLTGRLASLADVARVEQLVQHAFRGGKQTKSWTGEEHLVRGPRITQDRLREIIGAADQKLLLVEIDVDGKPYIIGCIHVSKVSDDTSHVAMLAVDPDTQSTGAGKFLMQWSEQIAREEFGSRRMVGMVVSGREELMDWYVRFGYEKTGKTEPFHGPGVTPLVQGLQFVEIRKDI